MGDSPFRFCEEHFLVRPLGRRANDLPTLLRLLRGAPDEAIFCHVHFSRLRPKVHRNGLLNNFASWVLQVLGERLLAEKLAMVDGATSSSLSEVRNILVDLVQTHGGQMEHGPRALPGHEFYLCGVEGHVVRTPVQAFAADELPHCVRETSDSALVHHLVAFPLRKQKCNDLSQWLDAHGQPAAAAAVREVPVWTMPIRTVRERVLDALEALV